MKEQRKHIMERKKNQKIRKVTWTKNILTHTTSNKTDQEDKK